MKITYDRERDAAIISYDDSHKDSADSIAEAVYMIGFNCEAWEEDDNNSLLIYATPAEYFKITEIYKSMC